MSQGSQQQRPGSQQQRPGSQQQRPGSQQQRPGSRQQRPRRERKPREEPVWIPLTNLGKKVAAAEITSMEEILENGLRIQEAGIIKKLLPDLKTEVIDAGIVQKMTPNGQSTRFKALVADGNENGWLGIGRGKSKQMRDCNSICKKFWQNKIKYQQKWNNCNHHWSHVHLHHLHAHLIHVGRFFVKASNPFLILGAKSSHSFFLPSLCFFHNSF